MEVACTGHCPTPRLAGSRLLYTTIPFACSLDAYGSQHPLPKRPRTNQITRPFYSVHAGHAGVHTFAHYSIASRDGCSRHPSSHLNASQDSPRVTLWSAYRPLGLRSWRIYDPQYPRCDDFPQPEHTHRQYASVRCSVPVRVCESLPLAIDCS